MMISLAVVSLGAQSCISGTPRWRGPASSGTLRASSLSGSKSSFSRKRSRLREETLAKLAQVKGFHC